MKNNPDAAAEKREAANCPFYPACYIAGDCSFEDWRNGDCGLPKAEQQRKRDAWLANLKLTNARHALATKLAGQANAGDLDHLLQAPKS